MLVGSQTRRLALGRLAAGGLLLAAPQLAFGQVPEIPPAEPDESPTTVAITREALEHVTAPVRINGQGPFRFMVDTGANISCVSQELAQALALPAGREVQVHTIVGRRSRPSVVLDRLEIGTRTRKHVAAQVLPMAGFDIDGVLGIDWLKGQRLVMNFKSRELEITRSQSDVGETGRVVVVPARRRHGQLTIVDADLNGRRISAIIDSGAQATMCNTRLRDLARAQEERKGRREAPVFVKMESLAGEPFTGESVFLPFLRLGGLHLGNVPVTCADVHVFRIWGLEETPALVIGIDLLSQFEQVALDFGRSQVRFDFV